MKELKTTVEILEKSLQHRKNSQNLIRENMKAKQKLIKMIASVIIGISGFALVWIFSSFLVALGILLMIWANNIDKSNTYD
jgi:succinate dehydrogenase/fumarate reductase cytochrome b subunit